MEKSPIRSLHHVTATVDDARQDLDFYRDLLGLRLVKRTVNFDNHHVYHFYYGDERGMPGTIWTTFPYKGHGVPVGRIGAGQIAVTSFSVPHDSLEYWRERLGARGVPVGEPAPTFGEERIAFSDPSGLAMELIAGDRDARTPWTGADVTPDAAIRGLHGVTLLLHRPDATVKLMTELLGFERVSRDHWSHSAGGERGRTWQAHRHRLRHRGASGHQRPRHRPPRRHGDRRRGRAARASGASDCLRTRR